METRAYGSPARIAFDTIANRPAASSQDLQVGDQFYATDEAIWYTLCPDLLAPNTVRQWLAPGDTMLLSNAAIVALDAVTSLGAAADGRVITATVVGGVIVGVAQNAPTGAGQTTIVRASGKTNLKVDAGGTTRGFQLAIGATAGTFKTAVAQSVAGPAVTASIVNAVALDSIGGAGTIRGVLELGGSTPTTLA
jgi:hypothetical protein